MGTEGVRPTGVLDSHQRDFLNQRALGEVGGVLATSVGTSQEGLVHWQRRRRLSRRSHPVDRGLLTAARPAPAAVTQPPFAPRRRGPAHRRSGRRPGASNQPRKKFARPVTHPGTPRCDGQSHGICSLPFDPLAAVPAPPGRQTHRSPTTLPPGRALVHFRARTRREPPVPGGTEGSRGGAGQRPRRASLRSASSGVRPAASCSAHQASTRRFTASTGPLNSEPCGPT